MDINSDTILTEALKLPPALRSRIAIGLIDSLDAESDEDLDQAWSDEILRRIDEAKSDPSYRVPWDEAQKMIMSDDDAC